MSDPRVAIIILAGGRSTRMGGGDKTLLPFAGSTLLDHVLARLAGQGAHATVLNANGDPARFARFGLPVITDTVPNHPGPLAGVLAGMEWALARSPGIDDIVTVPADAPVLPTNLVLRLRAARDAACADIACATSAGQVHPVAALWPVRLAPALRHALVEERLHRVTRWTDRFATVQVPFAADPIDPFLNVNSPDDLAWAEAMLRDGPP